MRLRNGLELLLGASLLIACTKKPPECEAITGPMKSLSRKLALAQKVTSNKNSKLAQVAAALRPFADAAKTTGETLATAELSNPELKQIAEDASAAALALSESASQMADAADRMKGLDAARQTVNIRKTFIDAGESKIRDLCTDPSRECAALSRVLSESPAFPESPEGLQAKQQWAAQVDVWTSQLASVRLSNPELAQQTASLVQSWKSFAAAMTALAASSDAAVEMEAAAKSLSAKINAANAATSAAAKFCKD